MTEPQQAYYDRHVALWLVFCAAVLFGMILLGAVTRLTGSGLSMVEWKPLMGVIPPLSEQAWQETFDKYRQFPEYLKVNRGMDLQGFKRIFMFEYLHRVLGRLIGVIFLLPMLYFWLRGRLRPGFLPHLWLLFVLGGLQGLLGWYMVMSGLVDNPRVSQYRLTAHLGLAVAIYGYMLWLVFDLVAAGPQRRSQAGTRSHGRLALVMLALVYLMILSGGLVAGTRAGFAYPTWPLMGDSFIPQGIYSGTAAWRAAFEDLTTIHFNHRMFAYLLFVLLNAMAVAVYRRARDFRDRLAALLLAGATWLQVALGIATVLLHVPLAVAVAHQAGAVLLLSAMLFTTHEQVRR